MAAGVHNRVLGPNPASKGAEAQEQCTCYSMLLHKPRNWRFSLPLCDNIAGDPCHQAIFTIPWVWSDGFRFVRYWVSERKVEHILNRDLDHDSTQFVCEVHGTTGCWQWQKASQAECLYQMNRRRHLRYARPQQLEILQCER